MAMDFELTISGLCVIVLKSKQNQPAHPEAVDVICVRAHRHRPLLSYFPDDAVADGVEPNLHIDPMGGRIAAIDLADRVLALNFGRNPHAQFSLAWGPENSRAPHSAPEESWMNWVPTVQDLGFGTLQLGSSSQLPTGSAARLSLPPGELISRHIIRDRDSQNHLLWDFPATSKERALANEVVYRTSGVDDLHIAWDSASLSASGSGGLLRMAISNDMAVVPDGWDDPIKVLEHLGHLQGMAAASRDGFRAPTLAAVTRTGHPICNQVLFVDQS